ncbi:hypothetical protein [Leptospira noguchii]|uniref:hypothetical protein n=1 Tax=Leptospira noguchii TaxID=28182 RepID=UPI0009C14E3C
MLSKSVQSPNNESIQVRERSVINREKQVRKEQFILKDRLPKGKPITKKSRKDRFKLIKVLT